jgi:hypothetical protein
VRRIPESWNKKNIVLSPAGLVTKNQERLLVSSNTNLLHRQSSQCGLNSALRISNYYIVHFIRVAVRHSFCFVISKEVLPTSSQSNLFQLKADVFRKLGIILYICWQSKNKRYSIWYEKLKLTKCHLDTNWQPRANFMPFSIISAALPFFLLFVPIESQTKKKKTSR